jgi:hypothetical protein
MYIKFCLTVQKLWAGKFILSDTVSSAIFTLCGTCIAYTNLDNTAGTPHSLAKIPFLGLPVSISTQVPDLLLFDTTTIS